MLVTAFRMLVGLFIDDGVLAGAIFDRPALLDLLNSDV
jgi:hypothetical protein